MGEWRAFPPGQALERAKKAATDSGAVFQGDSTRGTFATTGVSGVYVVDGQRVEITVVDKPWYAPWSMIQEKLSSFFRR